MQNKRLIIGFHALNTRLWQNPQSLLEIYILDSKKEQKIQDIINKADKENIKIYFIDIDRINAMAGPTRHQGIVAFVDASRPFIHIDDILENLNYPPLLLILDGITDPHNLGAILRVADAMGVDAVIAPKNKNVGLNATVSKVACGAAETVPFITVTNLVRTIKELKTKNIWIYGTDIHTTVDLFHVKLPLGIAWVLGSEDKGIKRLTKENCDELVSIPMFGIVESLNVSVSAGIVLAETKRQHLLTTNLPGG